MQSILVDRPFAREQARGGPGHWEPMDALGRIGDAVSAVTLRRVARFGGVSLYVLVGVFPYLGSGLVVPEPAVVILLTAWFTGFLVLLRFGKQRTMWSLAAAPAALGFWVLFVLIGSLLFGWSA